MEFSLRTGKQEGFLKNPNRPCPFSVFLRSADSTVGTWGHCKSDGHGPVAETESFIYGKPIAVVADMSVCMHMFPSTDSVHPINPVWKRHRIICRFREWYGCIHEKHIMSYLEIKRYDIPGMTEYVNEPLWKYRKSRMEEWGIMGIGNRNRLPGVPLWIETNNLGKSYM